MGGSALSTKNTVGTYHWMAPEVLTGEDGVTEKCDVFSFGVILWEIATNTEPWKEVREPVAIISIVAFQKRRLPLPYDLQPEIRSLISDCWQEKPELRPTMQDALNRLSVLTEIRPLAKCVTDSDHVTAADVERAIATSQVDECDAEVEKVSLL